MFKSCKWIKLTKIKLLIHRYNNIINIHDDIDFT